MPLPAAVGMTRGQEEEEEEEEESTMEHIPNLAEAITLTAAAILSTTSITPFL